MRVLQNIDETNLLNFTFSYPKDSANSYYQIRTYCANCDLSSYLYIKKGARKSSLRVNCQKCECKLNL